MLFLTSKSYFTNCGFDEKSLIGDDPIDIILEKIPKQYPYQSKKKYFVKMNFYALLTCSNMMMFQK